MYLKHNKTMQNAKQQQSQASDSAQHTPAPWKAEFTKWYDKPQVDVFSTDECSSDGFLQIIASLSSVEKSRFDLIPLEERQANAHLIAAAPDLLQDHITDLTLIEDFIQRFKNGDIPTKHAVVYFLENLLVSKKAVIAKAKGGRHA